MAFDALVTAGGYATRFGGGTPKCLQMVNAESMLGLTLHGLTKAGCENILVTTNRQEYLEDIKQCILPLSGAEIRVDSGFSSTFLLAKHFAPEMSNNFFFCYGHAPRPPIVYSTLRKIGGDVTTCRLRQSSKFKPIHWRGRYLEPPYFLNKGTLLNSSHSEWNDFMNENSRKLHYFNLPGEPEFNTESEYLAYSRYVLGFRGLNDSFSLLNKTLVQ